MLGTVSDETLVSRTLAGSNSAWLKLVKRYEKRVYNYALRMVGHPDDAFDLMQEVFMGVHRNLAGFRGDAPFPGWLFRDPGWLTIPVCGLNFGLVSHLLMHVFSCPTR